VKLLGDLSDRVSGVDREQHSGSRFIEQFVHLLGTNISGGLLKGMKSLRDIRNRRRSLLVEVDVQTCS
jgi:hypothetical protein